MRLNEWERQQRARDRQWARTNRLYEQREKYEAAMAQKRAAMTAKRAHAHDLTARKEIPNEL